MAERKISRLLLACAALLLCAHALAATPDAPTPYPLWDGKESVASYAKRVNLPPTKTIDLGKGVTLELVLIPAGKFVMGTPEPQPPVINRFESEILMWLGIALFVGFLSMLVVRKLHGKKVAFSLRYLLVMTVCVGMAAGGYARAQFAEQEVARFNGERAHFLVHHYRELPAREVTLVQPFYMGKYVVTQAQYASVMGQSSSISEGPTFPMYRVSFYDAKLFCAALKINARLPTEAQWEYACRAGTRTPRYCGSNEADLNSVAWYNENCSGKVHPVGMKKPNYFDLYDMLGNAAQWCEDDYAEGDVWGYNRQFYGQKSAYGPCVRGSMYNYKSVDCRATFRSDYQAILVQPGPVDVGFRVVVPLPKT